MSISATVEDHVRIAPPEDVPIWDIDHYDEGILVDPYDYYEELRAKGPFVFLRKYGVLACGRYAETKEVFSDWNRFVSSRGVGLNDFAVSSHWREPSIVLEVDPPRHTVSRKVIARALSPRAVAGLKEAFTQSAEALIDRLLIVGGEIEAISQLAEIFPTDVFPRAVGLRDSDPRRLTDFGAMVFNALGPENRLRLEGFAKSFDISTWIEERCTREALLPGGFGDNIYQAADAGEISEKDARLLVRSLLSAGVDTTVTGIGNALWCFTQFPDQYTLLHADPSKARNAFEETLRLTSPVHTFCRTSVAETEVAGKRIPADAKILCVLASANTDPAQWPDPMRFDIGRKVVGHLAFGTGIHGCVGQNVARAEADALLSVLARRVSRIELTGRPVWRANNGMHALAQLPLKLVAA